jgi:hypothetical protein
MFRSLQIFGAVTRIQIAWVLVRSVRVLVAFACLLKTVSWLCFVVIVIGVQDGRSPPRKGGCAARASGGSHPRAASAATGNNGADDGATAADQRGH